MNTHEAQEAIFEALVARGYTAGLTAEQLTARQVCKMLEEVCELALHVKGFCASTEYHIHALHWYARKDFDDLEQWQKSGTVKSYAGIKAELADVQTTVANTAEALTFADEYSFDVMAAAVDKATADVTRGVR
jgi:hypothetical protein